MDHVTARSAIPRCPRPRSKVGPGPRPPPGRRCMLACRKVRETLLKHARGDGRLPARQRRHRSMSASPAARSNWSTDPSRWVAIAEVMEAAGLDRIEEEETAEPNPETDEKFLAVHPFRRLRRSPGR